ncbi:MAG: serine/threonine-protein kinase [Pseudomonadota bacterium]
MVKEKKWTKEWFEGFVAGAVAIFVADLLIAQFILLSGHSIWLRLFLPALALVGAAIYAFKKQFFSFEKLIPAARSAPAASSSPESGDAKMQALALQGQGQLDQAFEKFRRIQPVDSRLLDLLYNLALEFERKRDFKKAGAVYLHITQTNAEYRDVQQKLSRAKRLSETEILGASSMQSTASPVAAKTAVGTEKPMLGRYQVEKELGKGAMGVVYLGRDPKIGRTVAIKTMALAQEFEANELLEVKQRFFREAETAGRLSHPNIVQIFDAGEEHDLAYIAMEFVRGSDLTKHIKPIDLLSPSEVLRYVADAADALDYAHKNGVVHRDVKPANMMLLAETKVIKLMDFGIARLADSSKTKTGMVLGTPSYMSPEQLSGKKVDGRSDLFSLGVTLFQLLTGSLPFKADSMATLMFKIANEQHTNVCTVRPDLPPQIDAVINRALQKTAEARYSNGGEMARDLRAVLSTLS